MFLLPVSREVCEIKICLGPVAPVKHHLPFIAARVAYVEHMLKYAFDRREAGAAGNEYYWFVRILAQKKCAQGSFKAQDVSFLHLGEHMLGECAPTVVAHMQLQQFVVMGGVSQRKTPALAIFHEDIDILSCEKLQPFVGGELQGNNHYVRRDPLQFLDAARQCFDFDIFYCPDLAAFNYQVPISGTAQQNNAMPACFSISDQRAFVMSCRNPPFPV